MASAPMSLTRFLNNLKYDATSPSLSLSLSLPSILTHSRTLSVALHIILVELLCMPIIEMPLSLTD